MARRTAVMCVVVGLAILGIAPGVGAQVRLRYDVAGGCPDAEAFVAAVTERGGRLEDGAPGERELRVSIARHGASHRGSLAMHRRGTVVSAPREVQGESCAQVVEALAVVAAIALREDGAARDGAAAQVTTDAVAPPSVAASPGPSEPAPDDTAPRTAVVAHASTGPRTDAATAPATEVPGTRGRLRANGEVLPPFAAHHEIPVSAGTLAFDRVITVTLSAGGQMGLLPGQVVPRLDLSMRRSSFLTTPDGENHLLAPNFRVRISTFGPTKHHSGDTTTELFGLSTSIGACLTPLQDTEGLVFEICPMFGIGVMQVDTRGPTGNEIQSKTVGYGTVGGLVGAHYNLGSLLHLNLELGGDIMTQPVTAERQDGSRIFRSTSFGANSTFAGLGLSAYLMAGIGLQF